DATLALMRAGLAHRQEMVASNAETDSPEGLAPAAPSQTATPSQPAAASQQEDKPLPADVAALPEGDRAVFTEAAHALDRGDPVRAYAVGRHLFGARRNVYSVQDLRCKVALRRNLPWEIARAECDALMKLSTAAPKRGKPNGASRP